MRYDAIIFDGKNTAHKAYNVNKHLSVTLDGEKVNTGMMYGFLSMLERIYYQFAKTNTRVYIGWDSENSAESNQQIDEHYKENRKPTNEQELMDRINFNKLVKGTMGILSTLNIMQFQKPSVEADDVIATLATKLSVRGKSVLIITEDKDYRQLISDKIHLYGITQRLVWDISVFQTKTGLFKPTHFVDYLAICGDSSDGYSGVFGFGDSKAMQLLNDQNFVAYDCIVPFILKNPDQIQLVDAWTDKTKQSFLDGLSDLDISYKLAKLNTDIRTVEVTPITSYYSLDAFKAIISAYQMKSLLKNMGTFERIFSSTHYWKNHEFHV